MITIGFNSYMDNYTPESSNSHFCGSREELMQLIRENYHLAYPGDVKGTVKVPVPATNVMTPLAPLTEGQAVAGIFRARFPGDTPSLSLWTTGEKVQAKSATVILYSRDTLWADWDRACSRAIEQGKDIPPRSAFVSTDCQWEAAVLLGHPTDEPEPQNPVSMARNILGLAGGSEDDETTREQLAKAVMFWAQHVNVKSPT